MLPHVFWLLMPGLCPRKALGLAGGQEPLHDRFAARLREHFAARGEKFDVSFTDQIVAAIEALFCA